jgi:hypothetical protein
MVWLDSVANGTAERSVKMAAKYTFARRCGAFTASGRDLVYVPDQVIEDREGFSGMSFTVMRKDGSKTRATLKQLELPGEVSSKTSGEVTVQEHTLTSTEKMKWMAQMAPVVTLH